MKLTFRKPLLPVVALTAAVMIAGCPLPFEYNGKGTGTSHTTDPSSPSITAPVTVSYSVQGGPSGTVGDGGSFYAGQTMTVTLSTATVSALIFYTDDGTPLSLSSLGSVKKISASSGEITITRATSLQSLDIHAIAIGPNMLPSAAVHATVGVSPYPILSITRDNAYASEDGGTATFTITSSSAPASDITVNLATSGDYEPGDVTGLPASGLPLSATLLAGATTTTIAITGQPDADGVNDTVTLTIQAGSTTPPLYTVGAPASASVVIQDNRAPVLTLSGSPTSLVDGQISVFTVFASFAPDADRTVNISSSGYTAGKVSVPTSVTIPAGATSAQFQVVGPSEVGYEVQNPTVSLVPGIGYTIGSPGAVTLQIRDDVMGVFEYDGVWGFTTGTGSNVGTGASWNLTGNVTLGSGGLTFGGVYSSDDATVAVSNGSADFDKNRFTLAVKFTMADLSQARPIIAGGPGYRWIIAQSDTAGALSVDFNNHGLIGGNPVDPAYNLDLGMTIAAGTTYTLVLNVDVAAHTLTAWLNGVSVTRSLPSYFAWENPTGDEVLTANDYSRGRAFKGTWDWVFAANGLLDNTEVNQIAAASGL